MKRAGSWWCHPLSSACRRRAAPLQICGFNVPRGWGDGILNLKSGPLPKRIPLTVVVGAPLRLPEFKGELAPTALELAIERLSSELID